MKKIWKFLVRHLQEEFQFAHYISIAVFLAIALYLNYKYDFEDGILDAQTGFTKFFCFFVFFASVYYLILLSYSFFRKQTSFWYNKHFWIKSLLAMAILSLDSSAPFLRPLIDDLVEPQLQTWVYKVSVNLISAFLILLPLLAYYFFQDKKEKHNYGLNNQPFDARPYFIMLALMLPLIVAASFHPTFIDQYPMYRGGRAADALGVSEWILVLIYEVAYALDFVTVEFFFRGFLVIGMMSLLGRSSVTAMAVVYCLLHFGKPPGEAISSIYGGYILGVIAYETKSIWGGIIVHVGIAWAMELVAFIQRNYL